MKKLYKMSFTISHQGCWTSKVRDTVITLNVLKYNNRKVKVTLLSPNLIVKDLKTSENVYEILKYRKIKNGYVIEFLEDMGTTVSGYLLSNNDILSTKNVVKKGMEKWELLSMNKSIADKLIEKYGTDTLKVSEIRVSGILYNGLTEKELLILKTALSMGYFNYPRSVKAKEVADKLGITKQDFLYHIRNSINKVITSTFN